MPSPPAVSLLSAVVSLPAIHSARFPASSELHTSCFVSPFLRFVELLWSIGHKCQAGRLRYIPSWTRASLRGRLVARSLSEVKLDALFLMFWADLQIKAGRRASRTLYAGNLVAVERCRFNRIAGVDQAGHW